MMKLTPRQTITEVCLLCIFLILVIEVATRIYTSHTWTCMPYIPNVYIPELPFKEAKEEQFVLLGVGDSFTYGFGVKRPEETFLYLIEKKLNDAGIPAKSFNAAYPGVGTEAELAFLKERGVNLKPDIVVLGYYVNDLMDNLNHHLLKEDQRYFPHHYYIVNGQLKEVSFFECFPFIRYRIMYLARNMRKKHLPKEVHENWNDTYQQIYNSDLVECHKNYPPLLEGEFKLVLSQIEEMKKVCDENRIKFLVIFIPADMQVKPSLWQTLRLIFNLKEEDFDLLLPNRRLATFCEEKSIPFLDMLPELRERQTKGEYLYSKNRHWDAQGHLVVANTVLQKLKKEGFLPSR